MSFDYVRRFYGVPAERGRRVCVEGKEGVIVRATNYVYINFDDDKPTVSHPYHPCSDGLTYLGIGKVRKMTRSQKRYKAYIDFEYSDCFDSFIDFCRWFDAERKNPESPFYNW